MRPLIQIALLVLACALCVLHDNTSDLTREESHSLAMFGMGFLFVFINLTFVLVIGTFLTGLFLMVVGYCIKNKHK